MSLTPPILEAEGIIRIQPSMLRKSRQQYKKTTNYWQYDSRDSIFNWLEYHCALFDFYSLVVKCFVCHVITEVTKLKHSDNWRSHQDRYITVNVVSMRFSYFATLCFWNSKCFCHLSPVWALTVLIIKHQQANGFFLIWNTTYQLKLLSFKSSKYVALYGVPVNRKDILCGDDEPESDSLSYRTQGRKFDSFESRTFWFVIRKIEGLV